MNTYYAIMVNENPPIVGERYSFVWPKELVDQVNSLINEGINQRDACQKVLSQYRAEESKKTPLSATRGQRFTIESE